MASRDFFKVSEIINNYSFIPAERGVYLMINPTETIDFLQVGTGGDFKGANPNVDVSVLESKWVKKALVVYVGQAGGIRNGKWSNENLRKRLKCYFKFGQGKSVAHKGEVYLANKIQSKHNSLLERTSKYDQGSLRRGN